MAVEPTISFSFLTTRQALENRTCRICGCQQTKAVFLNLMKPVHRSFLSLVQNIFHIQISENDRLPKHVCHTCIGTLSDIQQLLNVSQVVQKKLAVIAKELNCDEENDDIECEERRITMGSEESSSDSSVCGSRSPEKELSSLRMPSVRVPKLFGRRKLNRENREESKKNPSSKIHNSDTVLHEMLFNTSKSDREREPLEVNPRTTGTTPPDSNPKPNVKSRDWQIHKLPGSETMLYVCSDCHAVLVRPEAMDTHVCKSPSDRESSSSNSYIQNDEQKEIPRMPQNDSDDKNSSPLVKKKRTPIIESDSSDDE